MTITLHQTVTVPEGDGVTVKRLMPVHGMRNFDPFVLWDHFDISSGGFPDHPHRGFEAITYVFAGGMNHTDNLGNRGTVHAGGAQRFTAGQGIVHSEFPDGHAAGIQLWINLPQGLKSLEPDYQQLQAEKIPESNSGGVHIRTIVDDAKAITLHTQVEYLDIRLDAGSRLKRNIAATYRGFLYAVRGNASINGVTVNSGQAVFIEDEASVQIESHDGAQLMWCFGQPHHEPIYQHGPYVD
jgi:redox-sensitive bicupin YhaK (pirin superfamily)